MGEGGEILTQPVEVTQAKDPKGHPPLEHVKGRVFKTPEGTFVRSMYELGSEEYHAELFIEYERTFGRGMAKSVTHGGPVAGYPLREELRQPGVQHRLQAEWAGNGARSANLMRSGSAEEVRENIQWLKDYRARYPGLYDDVPDPGAPKPKISWKSEE